MKIEKEEKRGTESGGTGEKFDEPVFFVRSNTNQAFDAKDSRKPIKVGDII